MRFKNIRIKNFRNFQNVDISLDNKNVVFGMNDVGKTNFLYAIRFLLDKNVRSKGFEQTDYHQHNTEQPIEITLTLDIGDFEESEDTRKLVADIKQAGARSSLNKDIFYIKICAQFDNRELSGNPIMYWGDDLERLVEMSSKGYNYPIDNIFKVIYINPLIDLNALFNKYKKVLLSEQNTTEEDKGIRTQIDGLINNVNVRISEMPVVNNLQTRITAEYKKLRSEDVNIEMKSAMCINGLFSDLIPYIKKPNDENYYPTSGDGRKKLLSYSILNYISREEYADKILIYLIEEPENSLHRSMQIALSAQFFEQDLYNYLFVSTHSTDVLYEMDNARLIRIYSKDKVECRSCLYKVPEGYTQIKRRLNEGLTKAIFAEKVLLIEGPSEKVLFEKVMIEVNQAYELDGGYILEVDGIGFKPYIDILGRLNIKTIVKTDNDLRSRKGAKNEYELLGLNRALSLIDKGAKKNIKTHFKDGDTKKNKLYQKRALKHIKLNIYNNQRELIDLFLKDNIFLSAVDLENDLFDVIGNKMSAILGKSEEEVVEYLQGKKLNRMVELVMGLSKEDCKSIYASDLFKCLKELNN